LAALTGDLCLALYLWARTVSVMLVGCYQALGFQGTRREAFSDVANNAVIRVTVGWGLACVLGFWPPCPAASEGGLILSQIFGEGLGNLLLACRIPRRDQTLLAWPGERPLFATASRWHALALCMSLNN
jgi:hypothetical protein